VFFASGFAAVIYQVIWQRALLALYGANIESVTMVVAAFMLGLGLGSLLGGRLASRSSVDLPALFGLMELGIGCWGVLSLRVFQWVGSWTIDAAPVLTATAIFGLVLVPTLLMGATLPVLVSYVARQTPTVGEAVGSLYSINALGSATGAVAAILVLFGSLGQQRSVLLAASMNVAIALVVVWRRRVVHA
jgi:spermidine synthase